MRAHLLHVAASVWLAQGALACGSAHLRTARGYLQRGNLPLAIEVLDAGLTQEPGNEEIRDALILSQQSYLRDLRQDSDRLKGSERYLRALGKLVALEEISRRASELRLPGDDVPDLEKERADTAQSAVHELERSMDARAGRGLEEIADLAACRQLQALMEGDADVKRACDRLQASFKLLVVQQPAKGTHGDTGRLLRQVAKVLKDRNPELIEIVDENEGRHNARMKVFLGKPKVTETGWVMTERDAFHTWVHKLNKKGRPIEETVVEQPSKKDIDKAKKAGKPPPKPKKKKKKVWQQIDGEYRHYRAARTLVLPFSVLIEDLRDHTVRVSLGGAKTSLSQSRYFEYSGHPRGRTKDPPKVPYGRKKAASLARADKLLNQAIDVIPESIITEILRRVER